MRISDWSSDVCSSDLDHERRISHLGWRPRRFCRRDHRSGDEHARRVARRPRLFAHIEVPHGTAGVQYRGDAAAQVAAEGVLKVRTGIVDFLLVGHDLAQIQRARARIQATGLEEVHSGTDVAYAGRAAWRGMGCAYVEILGVAVSQKN